MAKELSMTPTAIRKREQRAAAKAGDQASVETTFNEISEPEFVGPLIPDTKQLHPQDDAADVIEPDTDAPDQQQSGIVKIGHARTYDKDGKIKKDSIWGVAWMGNHLVKFYGKRTGTPRFKIEMTEGLNDALELFAQKKAGTDAKKLVHEELSPAKQRKLLGDDYWNKLQALFYEAMKEGKVDQRNYS